MGKPGKWVVPIFFAIVTAASAVAAACEDDPAKPDLLTAADSAGDSLPRDSVPRDTTPRDSMPRDSIPRDTVPQDSIPRDSVPQDSIPRDSIPQDSIPRDSIPRDSIPQDSIPGDSIPRDTTPPPPPPPPPVAASISVTPESQERAVGDSGVVYAIVRDSAGREIWPAAIEWDLSDTSTVLRIRVRGSSYVVFDAVGRGSARLIARHETLADTGIVVVR
jgi:hypothetical protein